MRSVVKVSKVAQDGVSGLDVLRAQTQIIRMLNSAFTNFLISPRSPMML